MGLVLFCLALDFLNWKAYLIISFNFEKKNKGLSYTKINDFFLV